MGMAVPIRQSIDMWFRMVHAIQSRCGKRKMLGRRLHVIEPRLGAPIDLMKLAMECHRIRHLFESQSKPCISNCLFSNGMKRGEGGPTFAHWYWGVPIAAWHTNQFGMANQRIAIDARQLHVCIHSRVARVHFESTAILYFGAIDGFDNHMNRMIVSGWRLACVNACIIFDGIQNAQTVFQCTVATLFSYPTFRIIAICMIHHPLWVAEATHPKTFHVYCGARMDDQFAVVALRYWTVLMAKQYCWRFFH